MKRLYTLSMFIIGVIFITISMSQWDKKVNIMTEKAKADLTSTEKQSSQSVEKKPFDHDNSTNTEDEQRSTANEDSSSTNGKITVNGPTVQLDESETAVNDNRNKTDSSEKTLSEIKSVYKTIFSDLEIQVTSEMDQLLIQAKADYVSGKLSKADLVVNYQEAALALERSADSIFNALYTQLELDLKKYNHDLDEALEFRKEYNIKKQTRQSHLTTQLRNF